MSAKTVTFLCNKLVRDKTLERMEKQQVQTKHRLLSPDEKKRALFEKLIEEAHEVSKEEERAALIAELADVLEVVAGICASYNISESELAKIQLDTYQARGSFKKGIFLESISMEPDNPLVKSLRAEPEKYKEV